MAFGWTCSCGAHYSVPDSAVGRRVRCRACGQITMMTPEVASEPDSSNVEASIPMAPAGDDAEGNERPGSWLEEFTREETEGLVYGPGVTGKVVVDRLPRAPDKSADDPEPELSALSQDQPERIPTTSQSQFDEERSGVRGPGKPFWQDLGASFVLLLEPANLVKFVGFLFMLMIPNFVPLGLLQVALGAIIGSYVLAFLLTITRETASGEDELPDVWISSMWDDVLMPLVRLVGTVLLVLLPAVLVMLVTASGGAKVPWPAVQVVGALGLFFWPAVFLAVSIGGGFSGLWPHVIIKTALAAPTAYLAVWAAVLLAIALPVVPQIGYVQQSFGPAAGQLATAFDLLSTILGFYAMIITMRVVGLYYRHFKERLPWTAE